MLRISFKDDSPVATLMVEGKLVGPWARELGKTWRGLWAPAQQKPLRLDLCGVTFVDSSGVSILREIVTVTGAEVVADSPLTQHLQIKPRTGRHLRRPRRTHMPNDCEQKPKASCETCQLKQSGFLCHLSPMAAKEFELIKVSTRYPAGSILFLEKEAARGIFMVCSGDVKLSVSSKGGRTLIQQIAKPGEMIGLSASMKGTPYEVSAETLYPAEIAFIRREDFQRFTSRFPEVYAAVTRQLNLQYERACEQLRTIGLSTTAHEKLARLFLHWPGSEKQSADPNRIKVPLTHEQIAACLGSTRETVTRTLNDLKKKRLVMLKGTTVMIPDRSALSALCGD